MWAATVAGAQGSPQPRDVPGYDRGPMTSAPMTLYDSDARRSPLRDELVNFWHYRGLLRLLVGRDLTVRYKRSFLGVGWSLLNPVLTIGVMWAVFSEVFRFSIPDTPFIVYVASGILLVTFFSQGVLASGSAIISSTSILAKVYVPAEVFVLAAVAAAATNFVITLGPLLLLQLAVGVGVPWTVVFVPLLVIALLAFTTGVGLLVAAAAASFNDVIPFTAVLTQLLTYLTPIFYPFSIVPPEFRWIVYSNPLYSYLLTFRALVYQGEAPPGWAIAVVAATAVGTLALGTYVFARSWRRLVTQF